MPSERRRKESASVVRERLASATRDHLVVVVQDGHSVSRAQTWEADDDDDDVYYPKGRKPREDEKGEESYEKQRQRPGGRGLDARSCASTGRKDVVREVKGIEKMSMLGAGRGARERGGRRLEVEVNAKRRSPSHYVSDLVLETVEESCAFGEDIVLVGLR